MDIGEILLRTLIAVVAIIALVRLNGLRSFSKMSSFDFALTVAAGSIIATVITTSGPPWPGLVGLAALFAIRFAISRARAIFPQLTGLTDNTPLVLMHDGQMLDANLRAARVTRSDIIGKLREANALQFDEVHAVILEATGDISVLHGDAVDDRLLEGVSWGDAKPPS